MHSARVLLAAAICVAVVGCGDDDDAATGDDATESTEATDDAELAKFYEQAPQWAPCPGVESVQCAEITVPLDYGNPTAGTIQLAVNKVAATDAANRIGSLFVNPGGPGGSGVDLAFGAEQWASPDIRAVYDIVGFDPRGVANSSPISCMDDQQRDRYYATGLVADDDAEEQQVEQAAGEYAESCETASGNLLPYVGTENVVQDMDVLREVLGDDELHYLGLSYGTLLGQYYAEKFPDRVGRMVLDSVMNPNLSTSEIVVDNAESFDDVYGQFLDECVAQGCPLGDSVEAARGATEALISQADGQPIPVPAQPDRPMSDADVRVAIVGAMMDVDRWPPLAEAFTAAQSGDGTGLRSLADDARGFHAEAGGYDNSDLAQIAVVCLWTPEDQRETDTADDAIEDATERSAIFGPLDYFRPCSTWGTPATVTPHSIKASGTRKILLINNTGDPSTPLKWAEAAADQLDNAVLLKNEGFGHGAFIKSKCAYEAMQKYLVDGEAPDSGTTCEPDEDES